MKKLLFLLPFFSIFGVLSSNAEVYNFKAYMLPNNDIRIEYDVFCGTICDRPINSLQIRNDTIELYVCVVLRGPSAVDIKHYIKDFTPSGFSSYKGKIFFQKRPGANCNFLDSTTEFSYFNINLPIVDTVRLLGLPTIKERQPVSLFPNPTTGLVAIPSGLKYETFTVTNTLGQTVLQEKKQSNFSLTGLPAGLYYVRFFNREGLLAGSSTVLKE